MKINQETKVGVLSIIAIVLLILGFNFLKGKDLFKKRKQIYAVFNDLGPLSKSNEVKINGYVIGNVYDLRAQDKDITGIVATISLTEDVNIPDNSQAFISSPLIGSSFISIEKGSSPNFLRPGDTLNTRRDTGLIDDVKAQLNPTLEKVRQGIDSLKIVFSNINTLFTARNKAHITEVLANLNQATSSLNGLLNQQTGALAKTLDNTNAITANLRKNSDSITAAISNAKRFTDRLSGLELEQTIDTLQSVLTQFKTTIAKLNSTEGSLGALIHDRQLYNKLNDAALSAEILLDDLRAHPKRYVNISIFPKKDKDGALTSPLKKDTLKIDSTPLKQ
jgi:phospholipid/cholesterol/gamma-HCH transport system substrate-binding protein